MIGIHDKTQRILSDAHDDPRSVDAAALAAARKHARGCPRCRAFAAGLGRIDAADRAERAPEGLVERILAASKAPVPEAAAPAAPETTAVVVSVAAVEEDETDTAGEGESAGATTTSAPTSLAGHRRRSRIPRLAWALAAAAAVAAIFIGVRVVVTSGLQGSGSVAMTAAPEAAPGGALAPESADKATGGTAATGSNGATRSATGSAAASSAATKSAAQGERLFAPAPKADPPAAGTAPTTGFVASPLGGLPVPVLLSFDGDVWGFSGWLLGTPPTLLVQVGTVRASLGSTTGPIPRAVYERVGDRSERYIAWSGDDYQVYRPLSRVIGGFAYRMVSASPIRDWGVWPAWPRAAGTYPLSPAGLQRFGMDQYGTTAYTEPGIPAAKGVALPPDAGGAAPNPVPKWTWWRRAR